MEYVLAVIGVLALAVWNRWHEKRMSDDIKASLDQVMGRNDD